MGQGENVKARARVIAGFVRFGNRQDAAATLAAFGDAKGTGASAVGRAPKLALLAFAALATSALLGLTLASATSPVVTVEATEVGFASARAKGEVNPGEKETSYHFEYVEDAKFDSTVWAEASQTGTETLPEGIGTLTAVGPADLTGLAPATEYHLRLLAENVDGTDEATTTFTTQATTAPGVSTNPASNIRISKAHISGNVEPQGGNVNPVDGPVPIAWELQYTKASEPTAWQQGGSGTISGPDAESSGKVEVGADLAHLKAGTEYLFRLKASRGGAEATPVSGAFTTASSTGPTPVTEPAEDLGPTHASLQGLVNPNGEATVYWFEYGATTAYGSSVPATQDAMPGAAGSELAAGDLAASAIQALYGLTPASPYHYRLAAENASGTAFGADRTFTTLPEGQSGSCPNDAIRSDQGARDLPECRAYELASPLDKNGDFVMPRQDRVQAATDCTVDCAVTFGSKGSFADSSGTGGPVAAYMALRRPDLGRNGWLTHSIGPPQESTPFPALVQHGSPTYEGDFSPDLETGVYRALSPLTDDPYTEQTANLYTRTGLRSGTISNRLETPCPICETDTHKPLPAWDYQSARLPFVAGVSTDFEHLLLEDSQDITGAGSELKVYASDAGQVRLIGLVPPGSATSCGATGPACELPSPPNSMVGFGRPLRVLSDHGDRAAFSAPFHVTSQGNPEFLETTQLYQRDSHGTASSADDTTVLISSSEHQTPQPATSVRYQTASTDGHRIIFTSETPLTDNAPKGEAHVYMWHDDALNNEVQRLSVSATAGQFRLLLAGQETADLPFDASDDEVAQAIEALPAVAAVGGEIDVIGGPGGETGTNPYTITFAAGLAETDQPTMTAAPGTIALSGGASTATVAPWVKGGGHLTLIDVDRAPNDETFGLGLFGVIGTSTDASYIYFIDINQLVAGGPALRPHPGIFLWHEGEIRFIGSLSSVIGGGGEDTQLDQIILPNGASNRFAPDIARVSDDGKALLFVATDGSGLTGYDHGSCDGEPCLQYYLYHSESEKLVCVSCNPEGGIATGEVKPRSGLDTGAGVGTANHSNRLLTEGGRYAFFSTKEPLLPEDTNSAYDAYEYDSIAGEVHLLSSGTSPSDSFFAEASPDGHDVFIFTTEKLVGWDFDTSYDLYDVRVDGGFPEPSPHPDVCHGESCRRAPPAVPLAAGAGSSSPGPGNAKPPRRCPKGYRPVKRHGKSRCLKRHNKHKQAHANRRAAR
jgi:hypothetical protein